MYILELKELLNRSVEEFKNISPPAPGRFCVKDCCSDHDMLSEYFERNTPKDFLEALRKGDFDPIEFSSLYPEAYHYFSSAIISYCIEILIEGNVYDNEWLAALYPSKENASDFMHEYVSRFSSQQRSVIADLLSLASKRYFANEQQEHNNYLWAAKEIWSKV